MCAAGRARRPALACRDTERDRPLEAEARRRGVALASELAEGIPAIVGDRVQLQQVVLNLALNAMDAVAAVPAAAPRVLVRTVARRDVVEIEVTDNGPGIDPDVAPPSLAGSS